YSPKSVDRILEQLQELIEDQESGDLVGKVREQLKSEAPKHERVLQGAKIITNSMLGISADASNLFNPVSIATVVNGASDILAYNLLFLFFTAKEKSVLRYIAEYAAYVSYALALTYTTPRVLEFISSVTDRF
ncbi:hypothetical protein HYS48_02755, partial [Candidatus Woesearchaeota archaeon]|nr:hypothetical protein [Candidatus Woesearchaeota archaeon]